MSKTNEKKGTTNFKRHDIESTLRDMDASVKKYIEKNIVPAYNLHENSSGKTITVLIKNPERVNKYGEYNLKDDLGEKFNYPIIAIQRNGVDIVGGSIPSWFPDEMVSYILSKENKFSYEGENNVDYHMVKRPRFVSGIYTIDVYTDFMDDNNIITEQLILSESKYWKTDGHQMQATFTSINQTYVPDDANSERSIVSSVSLQLTGFILPKYVTSYDKSKSIVPNSVGVKFKVKTVKL